MYKSIQFGTGHKEKRGRGANSHLTTFTSVFGHHVTLRWAKRSKNSIGEAKKGARCRRLKDEICISYWISLLLMCVDVDADADFHVDAVYVDVCRII